MRLAVSLFLLMIFPVLYLASLEAQPHYQFTGAMWQWALERCESHGGMRKLLMTPQMEVTVYCRDGTIHLYAASDRQQRQFAKQQQGRDRG